MYDTQNPPVATGDGTGTLWPENATVTELREIIQRFHNDLEEEKRRSESRLQSLQQEQDRLAEQQRRYRHDMGVVDSEMLEEKERQNWCDDGYGAVAERINDRLIGGFEFTIPRSLVERTVSVEATVRTTITVWVKEGDDEEDYDYWLDEDGDPVDPDSMVYDACQHELDRNGWDEWQVR